MKHVRKMSLAANILKAAAAGGFFIAMLALPGLPIALAPFLKKEDWRSVREAKRWRIREAIKRLNRRRLVDIAVKDGREYLQITSKGKTVLKEFDFENLTFSPGANWDKKWRMVMFDIPENKRQARQTLQEKLVSLGFYSLQRSVFIYPYPCEDEVDYLTRFLEVDRFVIYCEIYSLGHQEVKVRRHFDLV